MQQSPTDPTSATSDRPSFSRRRRLVAVSTACLALSGLLAGCSSDSSDASSSGTTAEGGRPAGGPGGGGGGMGNLQTFTAVDLNTDGANAEDANTADVVTATEAFLDTLTAKQKATATYAFSDNQSRQTWSNYPASTVARKGVALTDLSTESKKAALAVVKTMLSADGYSQVEAVQKADDWLKANSNGGNSDFGDENYYIAVYGTPSTSDSFMVQFGGHHLARNYTYDGTTASITPSFTGTEPKTFTVGGTTVEPMKEKASTAFAVFDSLTSDEKSQAKLSATLNDILMGPGVDSGKFPTTEGVKVGDLTAAQQKLVLAAIEAWVDDAAPGEAASLMKTYESQLDDTYIAYANSDTVDGENTYLRIDGPRLWIELVNTRSQSTSNVHYHGVYRDKDDDYGSSNVSTAS